MISHFPHQMSLVTLQQNQQKILDASEVLRENTFSMHVLYLHIQTLFTYLQSVQI